MNIFLHPTTPKQAVPSAAESNALSLAYRHIAAGKTDEARKTLFAVFSPASAEMHYDMIKQRLAPQAPVITEPTPQAQSSPLPALIKFGLAVGLAFLVFNALTSR